MIHRLLRPSKNSSFFLFGARGTGKSTFVLQQIMAHLKDPYLYYDLLDDETEERLSRNPNLLKTDIEGQKVKPKWVIVDEVQKISRLLDAPEIFSSATRCLTS